MTRPRRRHRFRMRAGAALVDNTFRGMSRVGKLAPHARPHTHGVERIRDLPYRDTGHALHRLDIYRPVDREGPLPVVLYIHGGGFRILSKDSHWLMGLAFARRGYVVANISYRLAPRDPFPAAVEDSCAALAWVADHIEAYGGDPSRIVFAGESAGANLVTALTVCTSFDRPEPWARDAFATGLHPRAVCAIYGMFQVSDPYRFRREAGLPWYMQDRITEVSDAYLGESHWDGHDLADPVVVFERREASRRSLPPFFLPCGDRDPLVHDTRRLERALSGLEVPVQARYYPGQGHAFHVLLWRREARDCWREMHAFVAQHARDEG